MRTLRTEEEVQELVELARTYFSELSRYRTADAECRLTDETRMQTEIQLASLSRKIDLLKSNNELDRRRAATNVSILPVAAFKRRFAK